ncbi:MAG TPA: hypothetical protein VFY45_16870 [Baekduia sp.]|nr:hypothetical protein [Baekduia sp.]
MRALAATLAALLLLLLLGSAGAVPARPPPVGLADCLPPPSVRPGEVLLACGDGTSWFDVARWTRWTRRSARAVGTAQINDCTPSCVDGHVHHYRAVLLLDRPRACGGRLRFTRLRLVHTKRPGGGPMGAITLCPR